MGNYSCCSSVARGAQTRGEPCEVHYWGSKVHVEEQRRGRVSAWLAVLSFSGPYILPAAPALIARVEVLLRVIGLSAAAVAGPLCDEGRRHGPRRRGWRRGRCPGRPSAAAAPAPGPRQQRGLGARQQQQQQPVEAVAAGWPAGVFMSGRGVSQQHGGLPDQRRHRLRSRGWAHRAAALRQR